MKSIVIIVVFMIGAMISFAQTNASTNGSSVLLTKTEEIFQSLEHQWADAVMRGDVETINRIQADDFEFTDPTGQIWTKARAKEFIKAGRLQINLYSMNDFKIRVYGNTAIVNFCVIWNGKSNGIDISGPQRMTDVFVLKNNNWQCVSSHACRISTLQQSQTDDSM